MTAAVGSAQLNTPDDLSREPYKFLDFFNEKDDRTFAGRERDINEVVAGITTDRAFVLYSRSGLGKTSLLLAGVFPELRKRGFQPIYCRVLESPLGDMREALKKALGADVPSDPTEAISALSQLGGHPVLVLDQFEELFTRFARKPEKKRALVRWLKALLVSPDIDFHVLISLREDFLALLDEFGDEFSRLLRSNYRLRPLTAFGARQAIIRPLTEAGIRYEAKMVSCLVDILAEEDFDSLLLQLSCSGVYRQAVKRGERPIFLRETDLSVLGGIEGILGRYLDQQTSQFPSSKLLLIRNVLDALITGDTKRAATLEDIHKADFNATPEEIVDIIDFLKKSRLVREEMRREQLWYELMHERLVGPILSWFALDKDFAEFRYARDVIVNGARNARFAKGGGALLAGQTIEQVINPYRERLRLDPAQTEFVFRSAVYHTAKDVEFWIRAAGEERAGAILLELMSDQDATARCGAAAAAGKVVRKPAICERLAQLALTDPETEVRRAAGKALAVLGAVDDSPLYHQAVNLKDQRKPLIEALADAYECGEQVTGFGFHIRRRARKTVRQRVLDMQRPLVRGKAKIGAVVGLVASLCWMAAIGVPVVAISDWMNGPVASSGGVPDNFLILFWVALACTILSALCCWRCGVVAAENSAFRRSASWFRHILQTRTISVGFAIIALVPMGVAVDRLGVTAFIPAVLLTLILAAVLALAMQLVLAGLAQYNYSLLKHASREIGVAIWAILASLGLPVLVPLLTATIIVNLESTSQQASSVIGFTLVAAALIGVLSFALTLTLARLIPAPTSQVATRRGWILKAAAVVLAAGPLVWCALAFGINFIPILAKRPQQSGQDKILSVHLRKSWPNSRYFRLRSDTPQWFYKPNIPAETQVFLSTGTLKLQLESYSSETSDSFILLPAGNTYAWVSSSNSWPQQRDNPDAQIKFIPVPPLNSAESLRLESKWTYRQLRLRPKNADSKGQSKGDSNVWVSDQTLLLQKDSYNPDQLVEIIPLGTENLDDQPITPNKSALLQFARPRFTSSKALQAVEAPAPADSVPSIDRSKMSSGMVFPYDPLLWLAAPGPNGEVKFEFDSPPVTESRQETVILVAIRMGAPFGPDVLNDHGFANGVYLSSYTIASARINKADPGVLEMQSFSLGGGSVQLFVKPSVDISGYAVLSMELRSNTDSSPIGINIGNQYDASSAQPAVVTRQWKTYTFQLSAFKQNLQSVELVTSFIFRGAKEQTLYARNIKFVTQESPQ